MQDDYLKDFHLMLRTYTRCIRSLAESLGLDLHDLLREKGVDFSEGPRGQDMSEIMGPMLSIQDDLVQRVRGLQHPAGRV